VTLSRSASVFPSLKFILHIKFDTFLVVRRNF
jgi:hypothetical protein